MYKPVIQLSILATIAFFFYAISVSHSVASWHMINVNQGKLQGDANLLIIDDIVVMIDAD